MKYDRFEQLPVWQTAVDLAEAVYAMTEHKAFVMPGDLCSQLRRGALSISNNIAEGFERGTTAELLTFLYIARGSAGEVRSMLIFCGRSARFSHLKSQISNLKSQAESCSRQIRGWADSLQNSDIAGQRRLTDQSRIAYESKQRAENFLRRVDEAVRSKLPRNQIDEVE
jgi:four helix bundle protein